jgi:hypothetical protein
LTPGEVALLLVAGLWAGVQNALAGGGSFVTLPALILSGMDALSANITSTVALSPGQVATGLAGRSMVRGAQSLSFRALFVISLIGGVLGAVLLLATPASIFERLVPWLVLFATATFAWGSFDRKDSSVSAVTLGPLTAAAIQLVIAVYGGYFGGRHRFPHARRARTSWPANTQRGCDEECVGWGHERLRSRHLRILSEGAVAQRTAAMRWRSWRRAVRCVVIATGQRAALARCGRRNRDCTDNRIVRAAGLKQRRCREGADGAEVLGMPASAKMTRESGRGNAFARIEECRVCGNTALISDDARSTAPLLSEKIIGLLPAVFSLAATRSPSARALEFLSLRQRSALPTKARPVSAISLRAFSVTQIRHAPTMRSPHATETIIASASDYPSRRPRRLARLHLWAPSHRVCRGRPWGRPSEWDRPQPTRPRLHPLL